MFEFTQSNCVVAGTFNIYIIQPHWLSEIGVVPAGAKISLQADMRSPGFKFKLPDDNDLLWSIRPDRLSVQSDRFAVDCGKPISKVLEQLPWTPVLAVGCNATFTASLDQFDKISRFFPSELIADDYSFAQKTYHRGIQRDGLVFNIQLSVTHDSIDLSLNTHTDAKKDRVIRDANQIAQESCKSFGAQRDEAIQLAKSLLNVEIGE